MTERMLISFNHPVAIMLDGRVILTGSAICEEAFQIKTEISPKAKKPKTGALGQSATGEQMPSTEQPEPDEPPIEKAERLTLDFPMFLKVISLGDGKVLNQPIDLIVKWNNISAICELK